MSTTISPAPGSDAACGVSEADAVWVHGLSKRFGATQAIDDMSLSIAPGSTCGLVGPNGAGKTTLLRLLVGLEQPTSGSIRVLGLDPHRDPLPIRERLGYVPDTIDAERWMTGTEVLRFCRGLRRHWNAPLAAELVDRFGIPLRTRVGNLSRGTLVKLALVAAVAAEPEILILDEPMAGLDPLAREEVVEAVIGAAPERPWTVLFSSHSLDDVRRLADSIAIVVGGRLVHHGPTEALLAAMRRVRVRLDGGTAPPLPEGIDVVGQRMAGREWTLVVRNGGSEVIERLQALPNSEVVGVDPLSLEDIFKELARPAAGRPPERNRP